jgi:hypothetical protein
VVGNPLSETTNSPKNVPDTVSFPKTPGRTAKNKILLRLAIVLPLAIGLLASFATLVTTRTRGGLRIADVRYLDESNFGAAVESGFAWGILAAPVV